MLCDSLRKKLDTFSLNDTEALGSLGFTLLSASVDAGNAEELVTLLVSNLELSGLSGFAAVALCRLYFCSEDSMNEGFERIQRCW